MPSSTRASETLPCAGPRSMIGLTYGVLWERLLRAVDGLLRVVS